MRHGRRVVRVHLGDHVEVGLAALDEAVDAALAQAERVAMPVR